MGVGMGRGGRAEGEGGGGGEKGSSAPPSTRVQPWLDRGDMGEGIGVAGASTRNGRNRRELQRLLFNVRVSGLASRA